MNNNKVWTTIRRFRHEINISRNEAIILSVISAIILILPIVVTFFTLEIPKSSLDIVKPYYDLLYDVSGVFIVVVALLALLVALVQSREASRTRRAAVIVAIESRWASKELERSRIKFKETIGLIYIESEETSNEIEFFDKMLRINIFDKLNHSLAEELTNMRNSKYELMRSNYFDIMQQADFFEYLGFLVQRRYLVVRDIDSLFGESCKNYHELMSGHFNHIREVDKDLAKATNMRTGNSLAYQNFTSLVNELKSLSSE